MSVEVSTGTVLIVKAKKLLLLTTIQGVCPMTKSNTWLISGYRGRNDYDGPADDNTKIELIMDSRFTKDNVEKIMADYWSKFYRSVAIKAELLKKEN
jgi:hypothetical protein